jgi:hypothetical protein
MSQKVDMGDWIKRGIVLACAVLGALKGYAWFKGRNTTHTMMFRAEGPPVCQVQMHYEAGPLARDDTRTLMWESETLETRGHAAIVLRVEVPLSCGWQPEQVRCFVDRDAAPWKSAVAERVTNPSDGSLANYLCKIEARATE